MKLQFSLATLLVCTALIAVATTASLRVPVSRIISQHEDSAKPAIIRSIVYEIQAPGAVDVAWRLAWSIPSAILLATTLSWTIRRLKSRRHTEPPVG